ncbi:MAG: hypothetical protein C4K58_07310 [Flavobacteriaceae bacterium]|nr:MAG: hypothetical protein C4K58_07310 [Flavobacteriaceae bacterium]
MMEKVKITKVCEFQGGTQPPKSEWFDTPKSGYVRMLQIRDFTQSEKDYKAYVLDNNKLKKCKEDDILIGRYGASIGKILTGLSGAYNVALVKTIPNESVLDKRFLYYLLQNSNFQNYITSIGNRAAQAGFNKAELDDFEFFLPDLETQNKIVAILDKAKAILDKRENVISLQNELKLSLFYKMFQDWKFFDEKTVLEVASDEQYSLSSGPFGSNLTSKDYVDNQGVLILRGKNITSGKLDLTDIKYVSEEKALELKRSEIKPNDIVIVAVGSSGKALRIPSSLDKAIISQNFNKVSCNQEIINPTYFEYCFNSNIVQHQLKSIITDAGRTFLSLTNIKEIKIPLPPIDLQSEFVQVIQKIESSINKTEFSKSKAEQLLSSISQLAFKGELDFNTAVDLEVLLENDYQFFKENSNSSSIKLLLERLNTDELNENRFSEQPTYDKAKSFVFELIKEGKVKQKFDEKTQKVKLTVE